MAQELVEVGEVPQQANLALFGTADPKGILGKATNIANTLVPLINEKKLYKEIGGRKHVYVDGWNTMLAMLGVFPFSEYSRRIERENEVVYEARVLLRHVSGVILGAGEAICSSSEGNWSKKDEFQLKSMAQTRATGKAARLSFSWIMRLAGFAETPVEDMESAKGQEIKEPQRKSVKPDLPEGTIVFVPLAVAEKSGETKGKKWTRYGVKANETTWLTTFDSAIAGLAKEAQVAGQEVEVQFEIKGEYKNIVNLVKVSNIGD